MLGQILKPRKDLVSATAEAVLVPSSAGTKEYILFTTRSSYSEGTESMVSPSRTRLRGGVGFYFPSHTMSQPFENARALGAVAGLRNLFQPGTTLLHYL